MKTYRNLIVLCLTLASTFFLFLWVKFEEPISALGLNGFTEVLGIGLTVFLIDSLAKKREALRLLPQRRAAHEDVRLLVARTRDFWLSAYANSVPEPLPGTWREFFSKDTFSKMFRWLDINSAAPVTPSQTWWSYLPSTLKNHVGHAQRILERHQSVLDPQAYHDIFILARALEHTDHAAVMRVSDAEWGIPPAPHLGHYLVIIDDFWGAVLSLARWCNTEANQIRMLSGSAPQLLEEEIPIRTPVPGSPCMVPEAVLAAWHQAYLGWQAQQSGAHAEGGAPPHP